MHWFLPCWLEVEQYPGTVWRINNKVKDLIWWSNYREMQRFNKKKSWFNTPLQTFPFTSYALSTNWTKHLLKHTKHTHTQWLIMRSFMLSMTPTVNTDRMGEDCYNCSSSQHRLMLSTLTVDKMINRYWWQGLVIALVCGSCLQLLMKPLCYWQRQAVHVFSEN